MTKKPEQLSFFTPSLNRSGSEIALLNLMKSIPDKSVVRLICKYKGSMYSETAKMFRTEYIYRSQKPRALLSRLFRRIYGQRRMDSVLERAVSPLWYVNTILLPDVLQYASRKGIPVILHVHELEHMYKLLSESDKNILLSYPKLIIANSMASAEVLSGMQVKVPVKVIYPPADLIGMHFEKSKYEITRSELGIGNEFVWTMSGTLDENKNPSLFLDLAGKLKLLTKNFRMIWLAPQWPSAEIRTSLQDRTRAMGLEKQVLWIIGSANYPSLFNAADGFVLTSKLESFSLVTLEALALGLPLVANNCRGVKEIVGATYGHVVEGENTELMCQSMWKVMLSGKTRYFEEAATILSRFDKESIQKQWLQTLQEELVK